MIEQLRQIAIFAKTVDHGSFRAAAKELRLSPSVVSHHVSQLEEHLGVALLYRTTRKLALTPHGERLLESAHEMLTAVESGLSDISRYANQPTGELRITAPSVLAQSKFTKALGDFSARYPGIKFSLNFSDARQSLIDGGFDIAIRMVMDKKPSHLTKTLFTDERRLVASTDYLANQPPVHKPADLIDWDWLELAPVHHIKPTFKKTGEKTVSFKARSRISANDARALCHLVRTGAGVTIVPELLVEEDVAAGNVAHVLPEWDLGSVIVFAEWPASAPRHGLIRLFVNEMAEALAQ